MSDHHQCNQTGASGCQTSARHAEAVVFEPRVDIVETEQEITLFADLPGVQPDTLDVQFEDGELKIHGKVAPRGQADKLWVNEYTIGDFTRSFTVGETLDAERINAELKNGVLTVHLPKVEKAKPRRVEIKA